MSNGLHLNEDITQIGDILQEYFSPEDLFEIFALDMLDNDLIEDNEHMIDLYMSHNNNSINSNNFFDNTDINQEHIIKLNKKEISYNNYYYIQGAA